MGNFLARPGTLFLLALPTIILVSILDPSNIGMKDTGGWSVFVYIFFFLPGFVFVPNKEVQGRLLKQRWVSLVLAFILTLAYWSMEDVNYGTVGYVIESTLISLASWSMIFATDGFCTPTSDLYQSILEICQRGCASILHSSPACAALRGFLCRAMVAAYSGQIHRDPDHILCVDHGIL